MFAVCWTKIYKEGVQKYLETEEIKSDDKKGKENMSRILEKVLLWLHSVNPRLAELFRKKPYLVLVAGLILLALILLGIYIVLSILGAIFKSIHRGIWQAIVGFIIVLSAVGIVHRLVEALAKLFLLALFLIGTYLAIRNSDGWGEVIMFCMFAGGVIGLITLPLHTFLWKK